MDEEFSEGPKFFELCPVFSNYIQYIFPGGAKNFLEGASHPLRPPGYGPGKIARKLMPVDTCGRYVSLTTSNLMKRENHPFMRKMGHLMSPGVNHDKHIANVKKKNYTNNDKSNLAVGERR